MKPIYSKQYDLKGQWLVPTSCACCVKCRLKVDETGKPFTMYDREWQEYRRWCVHGGPYKGYANAG